MSMLLSRFDGIDMHISLNHLLLVAMQLNIDYMQDETAKQYDH